MECYTIKFTKPDGSIGWSWAAPGADFTGCQDLARRDGYVPRICIYLTPEDADRALEHANRQYGPDSAAGFNWKAELVRVTVHDGPDERKATDRIAELEAQVAALSEFKSYVHHRLDMAGIPTHPEGPHSAKGCRIGDRLDAVIHEANIGRAFGPEKRKGEAE